jgi:O-antigen ligase/polysaccharide polymerase Wzy-like membrane protein
MSRPMSRATPMDQRPVWLIGLGASAVVCIAAGLGVLSLPGVAVLAGAALGGSLAVLRFAPHAFVVIVPALMPLQQLRFVFPYEIAFAVFVMSVLARGIALRAAWLTRLEDIEVANLALVAWAVFTGLWCPDPTLYLLGVRRFVLGWVSFWVAYRLARLVPRNAFELGLVFCAVALAGSALGHRMSFGLIEEQLRLNRALATDLGWGTANFIATLMLVLTPPILVMAARPRPRGLRIAAWPSLVATAVLQILIASRAATVLFIGGILAQVMHSMDRRRWLYAAVAAVAMAMLVLGPLGQGFLARFTNPRDVGSMVLRVWYFREAWRRTLDSLPWGIGLGQGYDYPDHLATTDPHNYWLVLSSELGIPGLVAWIFVLAFLWRRIDRMASTPGWQAEGRALQIAFWLSQLHTLVEPTFQGAQYQFLYFWVMGGYLGWFAAWREPAARRAPAPGASS